MGAAGAVLVELRRIQSHRPLPDAQLRLMDIDERVDAWLSDARVAACYRRVAAVSNAVGLYAMQEAARMHGVLMQMRGLNSVTELPSATAEPADTVECEEYFTGRSVVLLDWLEFKRGVAPGLVVHHGVRLLAAVALAARTEELILQGPKAEDAIAMSGPYLVECPLLELG